MIGFGVLIAFMFKANESSSTFNVIDKSGLFVSKLKSDESVKYVFVPQENEKALSSTLKDMDGIEGLLIIPALQENDFENLQNNTKLLINKKIGMDTRYNVSAEDYKPMIWFEEEVFANSMDDFFAKRPVDYTKHDKSITENDLF